MLLQNFVAFVILVLFVVKWMTHGVNGDLVQQRQQALYESP
jgi:hypothetical protein